MAECEEYGQRRFSPSNRTSFDASTSKAARASFSVKDMRLGLACGAERVPAKSRFYPGKKKNLDDDCKLCNRHILSRF